MSLLQNFELSSFEGSRIEGFHCVCACVRACVHMFLSCVCVFVRRYDYWCRPESTDIHPPHWCNNNHRQLYPPKRTFACAHTLTHARMRAHTHTRTHARTHARTHTHTDSPQTIDLWRYQVTVVELLSANKPLVCLSGHSYTPPDTPIAKYYTLHFWWERAKCRRMNSV